MGCDLARYWVLIRATSHKSLGRKRAHHVQILPIRWVPLQRCRAMVRDVDMTAASSQEFVDGSVVRLKLHDFLTYADAEFFPGPRLNVLLGPNGSGKSSIVCALCVGLAGSTKLLGRADSVGQFVRYERDSGFTEIELFFERGSRVIRRTIYRDNRSTWKLDGQRATAADVRALLDAAHIQIDNLCQFLPQDMVGQFSHMNTVQLLRATEQAVLNGELVAQHDQLVGMQLAIVDKKETMQAMRASLELKKNENKSREKEVERVERHEAVEKETDLIEKKILWLESEELLDEAQELAEVMKVHEDALNHAQELEVVPAQRLLEVETRALADAKEKREISQCEGREAHRQLQSETKRVETQIEQIQQRSDELVQVCSQQGKLAAQLRRLEGDLQRWQDELNVMPDAAQLAREKALLEEDKRAKALECADVCSKREAVSRALYDSQEVLRRAERKLLSIKDAVNNRREVLRKKDPDAVEAADWLTRNRHKLKRPVWGPVALELQVQETLHAKYVESVIPVWLLGALVVECKEDYDTILDEMRREGLRVSILIVQDGKCQRVKRPFSPAQMSKLREQFGITGFLDELVTAPPVIHEALRHQHIDSVLVGSDATERLVSQGRDDVFSALSVGDRGGSFLIPSYRYLTTVSKYGNRNATTRTVSLWNPRLVVATSSEDSAEGAEITRGIEQVHAKIKGFDEEIKQLEEQDCGFTSLRLQSSQRIREIRDVVATRRHREEKIAEGEEKATVLRRAISQGSLQREQAIVKDIKNRIVAHEQRLRQCVSLERACVEAAVEMMKDAYHVDQCVARVAWVNTRLAGAKASVHVLDQVFQAAKRDAVKMSQRATMTRRQAEERAPWETHEELFGELSEDLDELRGMIETNRVVLEGFSVDRGVLNRYRDICKQIQQEQTALAELEADAQAGQTGFNKARDAYHAKLTSVVQQIDASFRESFRQIGCVGEVTLEASEKNISSWGIERRARFRKTTKLTALTATEQSGGEKAVGTIMYLMALQSLTQSPFRLVDEVNQGMDEYNERKVFERISLLACGQKLPQYFVVTPKLIRGLRFHRDTTIHFIVNGPFNHLPQDVRPLMDPPDCAADQPDAVVVAASPATRQKRPQRRC